MANDRTEILSILEKMPAITLDEMSSIRLMDRVDSKFMAHVSCLPILLKKMSNLFMVQVNNEKVIAPYFTQYFDTPGLDFFVMHQNGKLKRQKIRIRSYVDSNLSFLEIKNKNNKGRTSKNRIPFKMQTTSNFDEFADEKIFLQEHALFDPNTLIPSLENQFERITFVNNRKTERITIDLSLLFKNYKTGIFESLENYIILELKQDGLQYSDFKEILTEMRIKQASFSKYCIGMVMTDPEVKYNRFKKKIQILPKINAY